MLIEEFLAKRIAAYSKASFELGSAHETLAIADGPENHRAIALCNCHVAQSYQRISELKSTLRESLIAKTSEEKAQKLITEQKEKL